MYMSVCVDDGVGSGVKSRKGKTRKGVNPFCFLCACFRSRSERVQKEISFLKIG